ncbi:MAG TPA: glycosyltransferase family 2 protein [Solirubrobacteraceae bacterium]|nr:glycosyltransferase family 2 protein [Solirubrobacteraceae bacterium]
MPASRETIAACLIVRDEQERLPAALASVDFCDETIVVDSGSCDRTLEIARAAGARVVEHPWEGFGRQRNVAIDHAGADWILEVDADERITPELACELLAFLADTPPQVAIGALPMREWFLGRLLGPSIKYPRYRTRLFRRGAYRHDESRAVHEGIWPAGPTWVARGDMHHVLADSPREALVDWCRYARLEATHVARPSNPLAFAKAIVLRPLAKFAYRVVVDAGWRDGVVGMLKIVLDCTSDSLVWLLRLAGREDPKADVRGDGARKGMRGSQDASFQDAAPPGVGPRGVGPPGVGPLDMGEHFGRGEAHRGPVRLVAIAGGAQSTRAAVAWLARAREAGADVALVTDRPADAEPSWLFAVPVRRLTPLSILRALEVVEQARPFDCVLASGASRRIVEYLIPRTRRGPAGLDSFEGEPAAVVARVTALARPGGAEAAPGVSAL